MMDGSAATASGSPLNSDGASLGTRKVVAFLPTLDAARARSFYKDIIGLRFVSEDPFAIVFDAGGTMLRIATVPELAPARYTVLGWEVPDIQATAVQLQAAGVTFERFTGLNDKTEMGIWEAPGGAKIAWFKDPDGNLLSITQF